MLREMLIFCENIVFRILKDNEEMYRNTLNSDRYANYYYGIYRRENETSQSRQYIVLTIPIQSVFSTIQ